MMNPNDINSTACKAHVVVIGDTLVDMLLYVTEYPEEGSEVKAASFFRVGGSAFTTAWYCHRMGCPTILLSQIGEDYHGRWIVGQLEKEGGVIPGLVMSRGSVTGSMTIVVSKSGQRTMFSCRGAQTLPDLSGQKTVRWASEGAHLHLSGYSLLQSDQAEVIFKAIDEAVSKGMSISLDPGPLTVLQAPERLWKILPFVTTFIPNEMELEGLTGLKDLDQAANQVLASGCKELLLKRGEKGCVFYDRNSRVESPVEPLKERQADTTGAGDSFNAGFLTGKARGYGIEGAMELAHHTARTHISISDSCACSWTHA